MPKRRSQKSEAVVRRPKEPKEALVDEVVAVELLGNDVAALPVVTSGLEKRKPARGSNKYAKVLPEGIWEKFMKLREDEEILGLRDEIGLLDLRAQDLIGKLDFDPSGPRVFRELRNRIKRLQRAGTSNPTYLRSMLDDMEDLIKGGEAEWAKWDEIYKVVEQRRKMVDTERKHEMQSQYVYTVEQMAALMGYMQSRLDHYFGDQPERLQSFVEDIEAEIIA